MRGRLFIWGLLGGVFVGVILGAIVRDAGIGYACNSGAREGTPVVVPISDRGYYEQAHKAITEAKESVHIVTYEIKYYKTNPGSLENRLVRDLVYARERGVDVRVVADEYSQDNNAFETLKAGGVGVRMDSNGTTTHAKLIIVDGKTVLLGSTNLSYSGLEVNNEVDVLINSQETARYFEAYFRNMWEKGG